MARDEDDTLPPTAPNGPRPPIDPRAPTPTAAPEVDGRYRLLGELGRGGFGVVHLAEQLRPVRRRVALKMLKPGMDSRAILARFEAERQALALMDHPGIARVLDGGLTESGRPYFVMELVRGEPLTDYCIRRRLELRSRLELFLAACEAAHHAHRRGIVHRDLKPSNILVETGSPDAPPRPIIIDFGVAKAVHQPLVDVTLVTRTGQLLGTPDYMSPEQVDPGWGEATPASDVHALGVILYELVTGTRPFEAGSAGRDETIRRIREDTPPRPSRRVEERRPGTRGPGRDDAGRGAAPTGRAADASGDAATPSDLRRLAGSVRLDLDWICMRCLEKDPARRYPSAEALAEDIRRLLDGAPIEARPPSRAYRLRTWVSRPARVRQAGTLVAVLAGIACVFNLATAALGGLDAVLGTSLLREYDAGSPMPWVDFFAFMLGWAAAEALMAFAAVRMARGSRAWASISAALALGHVGWILLVLTRTVETDLFGLHPHFRSLATFYALGLLWSLTALAASFGVAVANRRV